MPSILIVAFFRRIKQSRVSQQISPVIEALSKLQTNLTFQTTTTDRTDTEGKTKKRMLFPWWCLFIAYGLSFVLISISILLIIARGIEFGEIKTEKWLGSLLTSFFSSVLLSQPIKVSLPRIIKVNNFTFIIFDRFSVWLFSWD